MLTSPSYNLGCQLVVLKTPDQPPANTSRKSFRVSQTMSHPSPPLVPPGIDSFNDSEPVQSPTKVLPVPPVSTVWLNMLQPF